jgi:fibronectin type 3 domain-containing protein
MTYTTDGKGTFHGTIAAEKSGEVVRNGNLQIQQQSSGTASINLVTLNSKQAKINVAATGGTTAMILKGMQANTLFDVVVNSVVVSTASSGSDGTLAFARSFGSNDVLEVRISDGTPPDTVPPTVTGSLPLDGASDVSLTSTAVITFSEIMDVSATEAAFHLSNATSNLAGTTSWNANNTALTFQPDSGLAYDTTYTMSVGPGALDVAGNALQSSWSAIFTTEAAPPPPPPPPPPDTNPPSAPRSLVVTASIRQAALSWSAPLSDGGAAIAGYNVYRATIPSGPFTLISGLGTVTSYVDTGLANGVTYYYTITAVNRVGEGQISNVASARTPSAPSPPRAPYASFQDSAVTLTWTAPSSDGGSAVTGYLIKRSTTPGSETLISSIGKLLYYTDAGLQNGQTYYYTITAVNGVGAGTPSDEIAAMPGSLPTEPTALSCTAGNASITLSWTAPESNGGRSITGYRVYRAEGQGQPSLLVRTDATTQFVDTNISNGVIYIYEVSALNAVGEGPTSTQVSTSSYTVPDQPVWLGAEGGNEEISLNWSAPAFDGGRPIQGYDLFRWTGSPSEKQRVASLGLVLSYLDQGLLSDTTYFYEVRAVNLAGAGAASEPVVASTDASSPPTPSNLIASPGNGLILISWHLDSPAGGVPISGFKVYRGYLENNLEEIAKLDNVTSYTDHDLENGLTYWYAVSAFNEHKEGLKSNAVSAHPMGKPSSPVDVLVQRQGITALVSWSPPTSDNGAEIKGYLIYYSSEPGNEALLAEATAGSLCFQHVDLQPGQDCYYRVSAYNDAGESALSDPVHVYIPRLPGTPTGVTAVVGVQSITLVWQVPQDDGGSPLLGYVIFRQSGSGPLLQLTIVPATNRSFTDSGLKEGIGYTYQVAAISDVGESGHSSDVHAVPLNPPIPPSQGTIPGENRAASTSLAAITSAIGIIAVAVVTLGLFYWRRSRKGSR